MGISRAEFTLVKQEPSVPWAPQESSLSHPSLELPFQTQTKACFVLLRYKHCGNALILIFPGQNIIILVY